MKIGIIGAGKVGTTMGKYIADHGGSVNGFYSRTESNAKEAAQFTKTSYFKTLDSLIEVSDTLFITTTDGEIQNVWDCIAAKNVKGKVICHFSGSLSSDVFSNWEKTGAFVCSIHPIYAFSNKFTAYQNLTSARFAVEGDKTALEKMQELFRLLPNQVVEISTQEKVKYHAATSIASNQVVGLLYMAVELLKESGISERTAYDLLRPLVENNVKAVFSGAGTQDFGEKEPGGIREMAQEAEYGGCVWALTGPIERNDTKTVRKHLQKMDRPEWEQSYRAVGTLVMQLAEKKHPERSYKEMQEILQGLSAQKASESNPSVV